MTDACARVVEEKERQGRKPYSLAIVLEALRAHRMRTLGLHLDAVDCLDGLITWIV